MEAATYLQTSSDQPGSYDSVTSSFHVPCNLEWEEDEDCVIDYALAHMDHKSIDLFEGIAKRIPAKTTTQIVRRYFEKGGALHFFEGKECPNPTNEDTNEDTRKRQPISSGHVRSLQEHRHPTVAIGNNEMLANSSENVVQYQTGVPSALPVSSSESSSKSKSICAKLSLNSSLRATSFNIIPRNAKRPRINAMSFLLDPLPSDITELSRETSHVNASNVSLLQRSFSSNLQYQRSIMKSSLPQRSLSSSTSLLNKHERNSRNVMASPSEPYSLNLGRQRHETQGNSITPLKNLSEVLKATELSSQSYRGKAQACVPTISENMPSQNDKLAPLPPSLSSFPCEINNNYANMSEQVHEPQLCYPYQFYENQLQASNGDNWHNNCSTSTNGGFMSASMKGQTSLNNTDGLMSFVGDSFDSVGGGLPDFQENTLFAENQNSMGRSSDINMSNQMMAAEESATGYQGFDFQPWMMEHSLTMLTNNSDDFANRMLDAQLHESQNKYPYPFYGGFGGN